MHELFRDLRLSVRQLAKSPGFTVAAVLCLALGIGANSATFSVANTLLFQGRSGVVEPDRMVRLFIHWASGLELGSFSYPDYLDVRDRNQVLSGLAVEAFRPIHLASGGRSERLWASIVSANFFDVLGVEIVHGRGFLPEEDRAPGAHPVAVVSHGAWTGRFGGDPGIVGSTVTINGQPFTVVGVAPPGFKGPNAMVATEIWLPVTMQEVLIPGSNLLESRGNHWLNTVIGRLEPGVTPAQAAAQLNAVMAELIATYPDTNTGKTIVVYPESESTLHPIVRDAFVGFLGLMFAVVGLILLLACANVAGLLLARSAARGREIAVRLALGAGRGRLVRQLLTESLALALLAGAAGLALGVALTRALAAFRPPIEFPLDLAAPLDGSVVAFALAATLATAVVFGLAPALHATRPDLVPALKEGGPAAGTAASRLRRALVVGQVALSLVLLIGAGLALRGLENARDVDLGFAPDHQVVASIDVGLQGYDTDAGKRFFRELEARVEALPGVEAVGYAEVVPLTFANQQMAAVPAGFEVPDGSDSPSIDYNRVSPGYFAAMGVPLLRGRAFDRHDDAGGAPVLMINEAFARRFWPDEDPIGRQVRVAGADHAVIGVVRDGKYLKLGEDPKPYMYLPLERYYRGGRILHVRTAGDPAALLEPLRRAVAGLDPALPVADLKTMDENLGLALMPPRVAATVVSAFAVLALLLAAVGLYGVLAYWVSQGVRDLGVRMALGAAAGDVMRLVVGHGMRLVVWGLGLGLLAGAGLARLAASVLYGIRPLEVTVFAVAVGVLAAVALAAAAAPARRAARVDPMRALRSE